MLKYGFLCFLSNLIESVIKEQRVIVSTPSQPVGAIADLDESFLNPEDHQGTHRLRIKSLGYEKIPRTTRYLSWSSCCS